MTWWMLVTVLAVVPNWVGAADSRVELAEGFEKLKQEIHTLAPAQARARLDALRALNSQPPPHQVGFLVDSDPHTCAVHSYICLAHATPSRTPESDSVGGPGEGGTCSVGGYSCIWCFGSQHSRFCERMCTKGGSC
jgi:hypothetical protein